MKTGNNSIEKDVAQNIDITVSNNHITKNNNDINDSNNDITKSHNDITKNNNDITQRNNDIADNNNDITVIIKKGGNNSTPVLISVLPVLAMIIAILPDVIQQTTGVATARLGIITLLLSGAAVFYIRLSSESILNKKLAKTIIILGYLSSICLLLLIPEPETFSFWMVGGLLVAMLIDNKLGLLMHFNMSVIMGITLSVSPEAVIQVLIVGALMCMLAGALRRKASVIYASIIILSTNITIAFAIHNFAFETENNNNYLNSLFSILMILAFTFFISLLYGNENPSENSNAMAEDTQAETHNKQVGTAGAAGVAGAAQELAAASGTFSKELSMQEIKVQENLTDAQLNHGTRTSYEVLCDLENDLIKKMKQHSESLYSHAIRIGDLSYRAAIEIKADEMLALAGGIYHEVGKINGKNYIEEGLIIAEDYAFPRELKAILKEHNIKFEKPSSVEAAIVMISDSVESTIDYIEKNDDRKFTTDKIIENIFQMRMEKGTFDGTSLSLKDYKKLKEFYQKEYARQ